MDKKSRILFVVMLCLTVVAMSGLFYKTVILQDFETFSEESETVE